MAICGTCGAESARIRVHTANPDGSPLKDGQFYDTCPNCRPSEFERFLDPSERRFHMEWETDPGKYDTLAYDDGEMVPIIKDWAKGECEQELIEAPEEKREIAERLARKRAFARERNRRPLTEDEIERVQHTIRTQMEEAERIMSAAAAGLVLP